VPPGAGALRGRAAGPARAAAVVRLGAGDGRGRPVPSSRWRRRWSLRSPAASCAPGARSWRAAQQAVTRRHLAAAGPELDGRSWLEVVAAAERRSAWARSRGEARRALVDPVLPRLAGRPLPVPVPTGAAHGPCDRRWRWRARLGDRTGTPPADFGPGSWRELAGGSWSHWDLWFCTVAVPGFDGDWARLSDEIMRRSPRALVRSGLGGQAQPSGGPARTACRRRSGCRPARG
jgi:hypothetical protein